MTLKNTNPLGFCQKCRSAKIREDGIAICPSCDTKPEPASGRVVNTADPGHEETMRLINEPIKIVAQPVHPIADPTKLTCAIPVTKSVTITVTLEELVYPDILSILLQRIYENLDKLPFTTMGEAKQVMKIQDTIEQTIKKLKGE